MSRQDIIIRMRLAGEDFDRDFKLKFQELEASAERQSQQAGARAGGGFSKGFLGAAGIAGLGAAIGTAISKSADLGAEITRVSRQFNIGTEELQIWRQAASNAGVTAGEFDNSLGDLTRKIGEANAGNRKAQQSFVDLGVGFKTASGQARATDAVMLDVAKRIAAIESPSERARVGTQLFGEQFDILAPLLLRGADALKEATADFDRFGGVLSAEEIQKLDETNKKIEEMKNQLSRSVAGVVADNADAILSLADALATASGAAIKFATEYPRATGLLAGAAAGFKFGKLPGALIGGAVGLSLGDEFVDNQEDANPDVQFRLGKLRDAQERFRIAKEVRGRSTLQNKLFDPALQDLIKQTELLNKASAAFKSAKDAPAGLAETIEAPRITAGGGGGGRARNATQSAADREAERAAKEAIRNEEQFRDAMARTLRTQEDSTEVARIRAEQGDVAAAQAEAELAFLRQHPLAVNDTVEALAAALGITKELTEADKTRLQLLIDQGNAAQAGVGAAAGAEAQAKLDRERARQEADAQRLAERQAELFRAEHERAVQDVADFYEAAFRGGTKDLWRSFKDEGTRMIAEIAAQWTLATIAGQPFNFNAAASGALGRSPLASIFFGSGGAANDNGLTTTGFGGGVFGLGGNRLPDNIANNPVFQGGGGIAGAAVRTTLGQQVAAQQRQDLLGGIGSSLALSQIGIGIGGNSGTSGNIGGTLGGFAGQALGTAIGGPAGGAIGNVLGSALGNLLGGLVAGSKRGTATIGNLGGQLGVTGLDGNSRALRDASSASAGSLIDSIFRIADQLGGSVDASRGRVSIGLRNDNFRVDPTGGGNTKTGRGAIDFGSDQEAAIRFAIQDLIKDGVITGISQASQNLLQRGGDLEAQIEKAVLIESVPRLLRERLDPLGAAVDEVFDRFENLAEIMREAGASAEQLAEAQQLFELERAEAVANFGAASQTLVDFLSSLNAGANSPLSLREQRAEAERQLEPFLGQITAAESARAEMERLRASGASAADIERAEAAARTAAAAINQDGFTQASQLLLSISRQGNASSGAFFSDFDRIRALTGQAIGFVDQATAREADNRDPFSSAIARNTQDAAMILSDQTQELISQGETLRQIAASLSGGSGGDFIGQPRLFAAVR